MRFTGKSPQFSEGTWFHAHAAGAGIRTANELLLVVVFSLVLDCENRHDIQRWLEAVQGKVAPGSKVDHKLTKLSRVFHQPANQVRLFELHERIADCKHGPFRGV